MGHAFISSPDSSNELLLFLANSSFSSQLFSVYTFLPPIFLTKVWRERKARLRNHSLVWLCFHFPLSSALVFCLSLYLHFPFLASFSFRVLCIATLCFFFSPQCLIFWFLVSLSPSLLLFPVVLSFLVSLFPVVHCVCCCSFDVSREAHCHKDQKESNEATRM